MKEIQNPFKPGTGFDPPYLAGREKEIERAREVLEKGEERNNLLITGLRGVGKTVFMNRLRTLTSEKGWLWSGSQLRESDSSSEESLARRLLSELAFPVSSLTPSGVTKMGFRELEGIYERTQGLVSDKLKTLLHTIGEKVKEKTPYRGIIVALDESQALQDHGEREEYPFSLLLDVFLSLQKRGLPYRLVLSGLPPLYPKVVEARTQSERMFENIYLDRLNLEEIREAIELPLQQQLRSPVTLPPDFIETVNRISGGYPYFIQYFCNELFDLLLHYVKYGESKVSVSEEELLRKLDADYFMKYWVQFSERQRDLLKVIALIVEGGSEFSVGELEKKSKEMLKKPFGKSQISQMMGTLSERGILFRNRHGRYSFVVPLFDRFIERQSFLEGFKT